MLVRRLPALAVALLLTGCSSGGEAFRAAPRRTAATPDPQAEPGPSKDRFVPVREAVERLARHVDVPVVLPRDPAGGIPGYRGWRADTRYLQWRRRGGLTVGTLKLTSRHDYLWIDYGYAIPDGCGGRDTAVETDVLGDPALLWTGRGYGAIVWPVRRRGRIGRFGLNGSFGGRELLRLAESMETRLREAPARDPGC